MTLTGITAERLHSFKVHFSLQRARIHAIFGLTDARNIPIKYFVTRIRDEGNTGRNVWH